MNDYRLTYKEDGSNVFYPLWSDDDKHIAVEGNTVEGLNKSMRNIHLIQDKSGVDKLSFTINADHSLYKSIKGGTNNVVGLEYGTKNYYFSVVMVKTNYLKKEKDVLCASGLILFDWTPAIVMNAQGGGYAYPFNYKNKDAVDIFLQWFDEVWDKQLYTNYRVPLIVDTQGKADTKGTYRADEGFYGQPMSNMKNDMLDKIGAVIWHSSSLYNPTTDTIQEYYHIYSKEWAQTNGTLHTYNSPSTLISYEETEDITEYYTHSAVFTNLQEWTKEETIDGQKVNTPTGIYTLFTKYSRQRTEENCRKYGVKYKTASSGDDKASITDVYASLKSAVKSTVLNTSTIKLNPSVVGNARSIQIYHRLEIQVEEADFWKVFLITELDKCLDNPLDTSITVEEIQDKIKENAVAKYDSAKYGQNVFAKETE